MFTDDVLLEICEKKMSRLKTFGIFTAGGIAALTCSQAFQLYPFKIGDSEQLSVKLEEPIPKLDYNKKYDFTNSINESIFKLDQWRVANTIPGYVIGISVKGRNVWLHGDGFADIENAIPCTPNTVMRIASISKSITAALLGKMLEEKKVYKPIREYLTPEQFPDKTWEDKKVDITLRQLVSHIVAKPGTKYVYTTYGWTLISAVMESQMKDKNFSKAIKSFVNELGMKHTFVDENSPIIYNRASYYMFNKKTGKIENCPSVDNSSKIAGGGLLSTVGDLLRFGNLMLYSWKGTDPFGRPGYLDSKIVDQMWTPVETTFKSNSFGGYGIGWVSIRNESAKKAFAAEPRFSTLFYHSGGAVGASSLLIIEPEKEIVVAFITNMLSAKEMYRIVYDVTEIFSKQISGDSSLKIATTSTS
ncbi:hypothetical protein RDWZM_004319 [Blomia tropicalis]|uniref:Beta-lactamase-related domain-containing protein n=1 Tax=Blomia tropicalis TaxID=40697 RepID=A0A9Q0RTE3_BLOTA|nr:hypothetical protein RDWZM_004319 [Blomia tropicalis]